MLLYNPLSKDKVIVSGGRHLLSVNLSITNDDESEISTTVDDVYEIGNFTEGDVLNATTEVSRDCNPPAIDEFPPDGFTRKQRKKGWLTLHILLTLYCFWFLAIICDDYFVPAIESLCSSKNVFGLLGVY